ncbi:hypothetical protein BDK61_0541 [Haloarcula quadrata]|jgi:hypothetical protein|uniref:Uncharacterized protein n=3 Tax=Haloarcula TaxID=2237 RepID=Q5UZC5_HALMA|nr:MULTISPECIES: hypothetical protein [Haloarcula]AAV47378.1 unknown [Haloarcula marismortui ATCC 43049]EMA16817.1 hypothetical protein C435_13290 [Haloarcula californiae ATCC 33799]NHN64767.1 hypothetical protein [Haloarcula sp. JP-Z28]NHX39913.1 hypothetical protein [Haloarcula sp. R1-2]QCP92083.1 hypothetical protein E6P14_14905 [Haloarcula marismortui ATCC 43049]
MAKDTEACGRCSMSVVVDAVDENEGEKPHDPFGDDRIEVDQQDIERVSPEVWMGRLSTRIDEAVSRYVWGR